MSYLSIVLVSCLATLSLALPVARQLPSSVTLCPYDVTDNFTMVAFFNRTDFEVVTPLALGLNGLASSEYSVAVFTLSSRLLRGINEPYMNRRLPGLSIQRTCSPSTSA